MRIVCVGECVSMSYQSFPWVCGDSPSPNKLIALDLPNLGGKSVLDVGCNAGFFCGFAEFQGASRVVGVDIDAAAVGTARELFPGCQFLCQDWDTPGDEKYDVILLLSAISHALEPQIMLDRFMRRLKPDGLLVLETGVAPGAGDAFVEVALSSGKALFPTQKKLASMFDGYAVKHINQIDPPAGEPYPLQVYHVRHRKPVIILFMDAPHSGKTAVSTTMFRQDLRRISGDVVYYEIMYDKVAASESIKAVINEWRTGDALNCAAVTFKLCRSGLLGELCEIIRAMSGGTDFILDMYVSSPCRDKMCAWWENNGFFVVEVVLYGAKTHPHEKEARDAGEDCRIYMEYLGHDFLLNEADYLAANPGVAKAVSEGRMPSAQYHYWHYGRKENRPLKPE